VGAALFLAIASGCGLSKPPVIPIDPSATFALHREHRGLVVDRLASGGGAVVEGTGAPFWSSGPTFELTTDGRTNAAFWIDGSRMVAVRRGTSAGAPSIGSVTSSWDDGAIRLTIAPASGAAVTSDPLAREGGGTGPDALSRIAQTNLDLRGTYRGPLRADKGAEVGWLRAQVGPYQPASRLYEGALPDGVDPTLGVAAALILDAELDWIESHVIDVYQGGLGSGPLDKGLGH
jgi:hypothetical protein